MPPAPCRCLRKAHPSTFPTYFLLRELVRRGVDGLFEQYGARRRGTDFRNGQRLGARDHIVVLSKPRKKPDWMSEEVYHQAPDTLAMRELETGSKVLVTPFLGPKGMPKGALETLYRGRWNAELDLRDIKTTPGMEGLRCRPREMAIKDLWVYLLAYNLIRLLMAQAALLADQIARPLSFKHSVQIWLAWQQLGGPTHDAVAAHGLLVLIAQPRVGLGSGRIESRVLKRRLRPFPLLTEPRADAKQKIRIHGRPEKQR